MISEFHQTKNERLTINMGAEFIGYSYVMEQDTDLINQSEGPTIENWRDNQWMSRDWLQKWVQVDAPLHFLKSTQSGVRKPGRVTLTRLSSDHPASLSSEVITMNSLLSISSKDPCLTQGIIKISDTYCIIIVIVIIIVVMIIMISGSCL